MPADSDPVQPHEFVLRRFPDRLDYFQADLPRPVAWLAFKPTENDQTGLSVFRQLLISPIDTLATLPADRRGRYYVACLSVADVLSLGLTVVPEPTIVPGHAIIPDLSYPAYLNDKRRGRELMVALAELAARGIVVRPTDK